MQERDQRDRTRAEAPLTQAPDAVYIDSTGLSPDEVEEAILEVIVAHAYQTERNSRLNDLLVMKFGGTSVGSADRCGWRPGLRPSRRSKRPVAIVVSAMSKITDLLLDTMRHAEAATRAGLEANIRKLRERHLETCTRTAAGGPAATPRCAASTT